MNILDGFKKLLGQAGQTAQQVAQQAAPLLGGAAIGRGVQQIQQQNRQPIKRQVPQMMKAMPYMNRLGENLSQDELRRQTSMQNGQYAQNFVGRQQETPGEIYPQYELPEVQRVQEDDAFGYTNNGIQPLSSMSFGQPWEPMYQTPMQRLMRKR